MTVGKPRIYARICNSRTLMAGLAGGALSFSHLAFGVDGGAGAPPSPPTPIALAVQALLDKADENAMQLGRLKLSASLQTPESVQVATDSLPLPDDGLTLRRSAILADGAPPEMNWVEKPLILSQMLIEPSPTGAVPRWMSSPDTQMQLRSSRELSPAMPGAAGVGRTDRPAPQLYGGGRERTGADLAGDTALGMAGNATTAGSGLDGASGSKSQGQNSIGALGWEIPPIRWGGSLGYSLQVNKSNTGSSTNSQGVFGNLSAASYIYAPWFARVSGRLGITSNSATSSGGPEGANSESSRSANVVGGGEVNMFSSSRYPFRAYFDRTDSRTSGYLTSTSYVANRFGLNQNFRAEDGMSGGSVTLDRSSISATDGRKDDVTAMSGSYSLQSGVLQHYLNGRYSQSERSGGGESARLIGMNSSHTANLSDTLTLGATANYSDSEIQSANIGGTGATSRGRYAQLYGYGTWMPDFEDIEDLPLTLSGGVRYSGQDSQFGGESFKAHSLGANLSALYRYSTNLSFSANGAVNSLVQAKGESQLLTQLGTGLTYVGSPLNFGNFSYNWNAGANANWQSAVATTPATTVLNGQLGHTLSRMFILKSGQTLSFNASQSFNAVNSALLGTSQTLSNSISANLGLATGERFTGTLSTALSDVRTTGYLEQQYRILNIGLYGQGQISQVSSANINMAFSWSDQSYQTVDGFGQQQNQKAQRMSLNGSAAYTNGRFAGVRGLRYNAIFAADTRLRDERLYGNVNGELDRSRFSLTNRLEYRIGLLDFRLSLVNNEVGGKKNALLFFQMSRQIGAY